MKIRAVIVIELDDSWDMEGDSDGQEWFKREVMGSKSLIMTDRGEWGYDVGKVKMINWEIIDEH